MKISENATCAFKRTIIFFNVRVPVMKENLPEQCWQWVVYTIAILYLQTTNLCLVSCIFLELYAQEAVFIFQRQCYRN